MYLIKLWLKASQILKRMKQIIQGLGAQSVPNKMKIKQIQTETYQN